MNKILLFFILIFLASCSDNHKIKENLRSYMLSNLINDPGKFEITKIQITDTITEFDLEKQKLENELKKVVTNNRQNNIDEIEKYILELYNYIGGKKRGIEFDAFKKDISTNAKYNRNIYDYIGGIDSGIDYESFSLDTGLKNTQPQTNINTMDELEEFYKLYVSKGGKSSLFDFESTFNQNRENFNEVTAKYGLNYEDFKNNNKLASNDKLLQYYNYLKEAGADVPPTFESFNKTLANEAARKQYYAYLKLNGFDAPDTYEAFNNALFKKKRNDLISKKPEYIRLKAKIDSLNKNKDKKSVYYIGTLKARVKNSKGRLMLQNYNFKLDNNKNVLEVKS